MTLKNCKKLRKQKQKQQQKMKKIKAKKHQNSHETSNPVSEIRNNLIDLYEEDEYDWIGVPLMGKDRFTFHHIIPKHLEGPNTRENGSIICGVMHPLIHIVERYDPAMFDYITETLQSINNQGYFPDENQIYELQSALQYFYKLYNRQLSSGEFYTFHKNLRIITLCQGDYIERNEGYSRTKTKGNC